MIESDVRRIYAHLSRIGRQQCLHQTPTLSSSTFVTSQKTHRCGLTAFSSLILIPPCTNSPKGPAQDKTIQFYISYTSFFIQLLLFSHPPFICRFYLFWFFRFEIRNFFSFFLNHPSIFRPHAFVTIRHGSNVSKLQGGSVVHIPVDEDLRDNRGCFSRLC